MITKEEIIGQLADQFNYKPKNVEGDGHLMTADGALALRPGRGQRSLVLAPEAHTSLEKLTGASGVLLTQLSDKTRMDVLNELLTKKHEYTVMVRDQMIHGFAPLAHYPTVDVNRIIRSVEGAYKDGEFNRLLVDKPTQSVQIEVINPNETMVDPQDKPHKGDIVRGGAVVKFSPLGVTQPEVDAFVLRCWCGNGAVHTEYLNRYHYHGGGEGDGIWQWYRESMKESLKALPKIIELYRRLKTERFSDKDRAAILEGMIQEAKLPEDVAKVIRARALEEVPQNTYDMFNLMTFASSHLLSEPRQILAAQHAARNYVSTTTHKRVCPACGRAR